MAHDKCNNTANAWETSCGSRISHRVEHNPRFCRNSWKKRHKIEMKRSTECPSWSAKGNFPLVSSWSILMYLKGREKAWLGVEKTAVLLEIGSKFYTNVEWTLWSHCFATLPFQNSRPGFWTCSIHGVILSCLCVYSKLAFSTVSCGGTQCLSKRET